MIGNTLGFDCRAPWLSGDRYAPDPVVGSIPNNCYDREPLIGSGSGDTAPDIYWRSDADGAGAGSATANDSITPANARSTAMLNIPSGSRVTHAYLYWSGKASSGYDTARIERPNTFGEVVNATQVFTDGGYYQSVADVTHLVAVHEGGQYQVGEIATENFVGLNSEVNFGAWALVVFYEDNTAPQRNLALFDGFDTVTSGANQTANLAGFLVPNSGFDAKLGVIAYDGDASADGDSLWFGPNAGNLTQLSHLTNTSNNFFNSSRTHLGSPVSVAGDLPQLTGGADSMASFDLHVVDVTGQMIAGQTQATIQARTATSGDTDVYFLGAFVTSIATLEPTLTESTKLVVDDDGDGLVLAGDTLTYTITVKNTGRDAAINTVLTDTLPANTSFVPGSLSVVSGPNAGTKTDGPGDDQGEVVGSQLTVRLGSGANATDGGKLAINEQTVVSFKVKVDDAAPVGTTISNQAKIGYAGELDGTGTVKEVPTDGDPANPGTATPTEVIIECGDDSDCAPGWVCDTSNSPQLCVDPGIGAGGAGGAGGTAGAGGSTTGGAGGTAGAGGTSGAAGAGGAGGAGGTAGAGGVGGSTTGGTGGAAGSGGTSTGGSAGAGGTAGAGGSAGAGGIGGSTTGGTAGAGGIGGSAGNNTGGSATGGSATGGSATGGSSQGGSSTTTGGSSQGGSSQGGSSQGGSSATTGGTSGLDNDGRIEGGGCSCQVPSGSSSPAPLGLALGALGLVALRRRRRS